jgi:hypothetical protein
MQGDRDNDVRLKITAVSVDGLFKELPEGLGKGQLVTIFEALYGLFDSPLIKTGSIDFREIGRVFQAIATVVERCFTGERVRTANAMPR